MKYKSICLLIFFMIMRFSLVGQVDVKGLIKNNKDTPVANAHINLMPLDVSTMSNSRGEFQFKQVKSGTYQVTISHLGYKKIIASIQIQEEDLSIEYTVEPDILNLDEVVLTGTFDPRQSLTSSTSFSQINSQTLRKHIQKGTADLLQAIPGTFTDASAGEVFTKVYTRGISANAEDDIGWYYVSLQEDGLPVSLIQHSYYSPDIFHRVDLTTKKVEAIRGGSASITALNAPGGIYNFISQEDASIPRGVFQLQTGLQGESNPYYRIDGNYGSPLSDNWSLNIGGHYRVDEGARNTDFTFSKGGQLKFNLIKKHKNGRFKFYGKLLDDYTNRWTGIAATNWEDPQAAFGQDFNSTSLLMPAFNSQIPDGRQAATSGTNSFDPSKGVHAQDLALGFEFNHDLGNDWTLNNNLKFSKKNANWQTSISSAFVSLNNPLAYFITGAGFPIGQIVFRDANSGNEVASLDNSAILAGGSIQYLNGSLPNDAIMGTSAWYNDNSAQEWMNALSIHKTVENHQLSFGSTVGFVDTSLFTQGSFAFVTYEANPRLLQVSLENPNSPVLALSDANGISNPGGLFFINAEAQIKQLAFFINDRWKISDELYLDIGGRYESINHDGSKDNFAPLDRDGGFDGDPLTDYDNGVLMPTGQKDRFDFKYNYFSFSSGINYKFQDDASLFLRYSSGNKAPELNYYFNNFSNVPINKKGEVQRILQTEIGVKWNLANVSFTGTAFYSRLKNIGVSNFEFDNDNQQIFYTPIQFNSSNTYGFEWESAYRPINAITFRFNGVIQSPKTDVWTVYDAAESVDIADDQVIDYSNKTLPYNPKFMANLASEYQEGKFNAFLNWNFMGKREGNVANAFQLDSYSIFNAGAGYQINQQWSINLLMSNVLNSKGLASFQGANNFGANANGASREFIDANPDASFVVIPVLPRSTMVKLNYQF